MNEFHRLHRPVRFKDVFGQAEAIKVLNALLKKGLPHTLLLSGPSGCGKTTLARILKTKLKCSDQDFTEVNCAESRGIDDVRQIQNGLSMSPWDGPCRIFLFDEAHKLTNDAQTAMLKTLEDVPNHIYFILATTDAPKLLTTVRGRCTEVPVKPLKGEDVLTLLKWVCGQANKSVTPQVMRRIEESCDGSARQAVNTLNKVIDLPTEEDQIKVVLSSDLKKQAFDLVRALVWQEAKWGEVAKIILGMEETDWERLRHLILVNAVNEILKNNPKTVGKAGLILEEFERNWYDSKRAGLVRACYSVMLG